MLRTTAKYNYGMIRGRMRAKNDDLTTATFDNVIGGAGPFDFTAFSAEYAAIPINFKVNNGAVVAETFDITAALVKTAVTVDELVTALTAASISGWTFTKQAVTGRMKMVNGTTNADVQVYGAGARAMMIGQGKGLKWLKIGTAQTFNDTPTNKEDTTQTITDVNNMDTEVIIEGYTKGWSGTLVDTAEDYEIMELVESGTLSTDGKTYSAPISSTKKVMFEIETYNAKYSAGTNAEDQIVGWRKQVYLAVKGSRGDNAKASGFGVTNYNLVGVNYRNASGVESSGIITTELVFADWSVEAFDAV
jgi:hypothetical protein